MTVAGNLAYPLKLRNVPAREIAGRVERALDLIQLSAFGERRIDQLSGGQRQRVALARAVIFEPRILLMDEPLSALDKNLREQMQLEVRRLHDRLGMTTVYVTHDQREALTMSDRIAVINRGRVVQLDRPRELYERPATHFVASFIGESSTLPIEVRDGRASFAGAPLLSAAPAPAGSASSFLVLRPEKLRLLADAAPAEANVIAGHVRQNVFQGDSIVTYVRTASDHEIAIRRSLRTDEVLAEVGTAVRVGFSAEDAIIVPADADVPQTGRP